MRELKMLWAATTLLQQPGGFTRPDLLCRIAGRHISQHRKGESSLNSRGPSAYPAKFPVGARHAVPASAALLCRIAGRHISQHRGRKSGLNSRGPSAYPAKFPVGARHAVPAFPGL